MALEIRVEKVGRCVIVRMERGENRLNPEFVEAMNQALDKVERYDDAVAMITTGKGKYFSIGLDLEGLAALPPLEVKEFTNRLQKLLARILSFPLITVAAINGHAYAGGAFLALVHDYKVMRTERGWYCFNEVHIKRNFVAAFVDLVKARFPQQALHEAVVLGRRYTAEEAKESRIVEEVCPVSKLEERAVAAANKLAGKEGLNRGTLSAIKQDLYRDTLASLNEPMRFYSRL